jgi:hypothetical protein
MTDQKQFCVDDGVCVWRQLKVKCDPSLFIPPRIQLTPAAIFGRIERADMNIRLSKGNVLMSADQLVD